MNFLKLLDDEISAQEKILEAHPSYIKLRSLLATRSLYVDKDGPVVAAKASSGDIAHRRINTYALGGKSLDAVNAVVEILRDHSKPMRTAELMPFVSARGIFFKGNAPQNILSSLLSRSTDVVSKGGHVGWALKEWDTAGDDLLGKAPPPAVDETPAQGREAGPGGGT